jgi:hypothetical protein
MSPELMLESNYSSCPLLAGRLISIIRPRDFGNEIEQTSIASMQILLAYSFPY